MDEHAAQMKRSSASSGAFTPLATAVDGDRRTGVSDHGVPLQHRPRHQARSGAVSHRRHDRAGVEPEALADAKNNPIASQDRALRLDFPKRWAGSISLSE